MKARAEEPSVTVSTIPLDSPIFNGKQLPQANLQMRKVKISETPNGGRKMEFLETQPYASLKQALTEKVFSKTVQADDKVIFPIRKSTPMPVAP
jgi:hypothetical protein